MTKEQPPIIWIINHEFALTCILLAFLTWGMHHVLTVSLSKTSPGKLKSNLDQIANVNVLVSLEPKFYLQWHIKNLILKQKYCYLFYVL